MNRAAHAGGPERAARRDARADYVPLFWRLFIPNATVLGVACTVLWAEPANGRIVAIVGGLAMLLFVNWLLMRRAFAPLVRLMEVMEEVDPLDPGRRLDVPAPPSEVAVLTAAFNDMLERLEGERRDSARRAVAAQHQERRRISRELHDEIGQSLTAHALHLDRIERLARDGARAEVAAARDDTLGIIDEVRNLAQSLRPDVLENLGLRTALVSMLEHLTARTGLDVTWQIDELPALEEDVELAIYRITQEATTNVIRHAGATRLRVALTPTPTGVRLTVSDDGAGLLPDSVERSSGGLLGIRERALAVGARVTVDSRRGTGTTLILDAPTAQRS